MDADPTSARDVRRLRLATVAAIAVSIVHYTDNYVNYDQYPSGDALGAPPPSAAAIGGSWFVFTAAAAFGLVALSRRHVRAGAWLLAAYSASGLVGIGHYLVDGATQMAWWRQLHVCADIGCGALVLALAAHILLRSPRRPEAGADRDERSSREVG